MLLNFHYPSPLANSLLISMFRNIDLWSAAIDVRISVLLTQQGRGREIRKKSILDFSSYVKGFVSHIHATDDSRFDISIRKNVLFS